jgi:hypothetical protein
MLATVDYYVSTYPLRGLTRAHPAALFRCIRRSERWVMAYFLRDGKWEQSWSLVHEMISGLGLLERISFGGAMEVLRAGGGIPDAIDMAVEVESERYAPELAIR